jgi:MFS superfamily sulfate permease-like transporter
MSTNQPTTPRWLPALDWLRAYDHSWLRGDVVAGITLAAQRCSMTTSVIVASVSAFWV